MEASTSLKRGGSPLQQGSKYFRSSGESESNESDIDSENETDRTVIEGIWSTASKQKVRKVKSLQSSITNEYPIILEDVGSDSDPKYRSYGQFTSGLFKSIEINDVAYQKRLSANKWIIYVRSKNSQEKLKDLNDLGGIKVKCQIPQRKQVGVIKPIPIGISTEQLKQDCPEIKEAYRLKRKDGAESNAIKVIFHSNELPKEIKIGYEYMPVNVFVDQVLRCSRCQRLGHKKSVCKSKIAICSRCGKQSHDPNDSENNIHLCKVSDDKRFCVNCKQTGHSAAWKGCPQLKLQKKTNFESAKSGIPRGVVNHNLKQATASTMMTPSSKTPDDNNERHNQHHSRNVESNISFSDIVNGKVSSHTVQSNNENNTVQLISKFLSDFEKKIDDKLKTFENKITTAQSERQEKLNNLLIQTESSKDSNPMKYILVNIVSHLVLASEGNPNPLISFIDNLVCDKQFQDSSKSKMTSFRWDNDMNNLMQLVIPSTSDT